MRYQAVQHKTGYKGTQNTLHSGKFHHTCTKEKQRHNKDVLYNTVVILAEEITCNTREYEYNGGSNQHKLQEQKHKEEPPCIPGKHTAHHGKHKQGKSVGYNGSTNHKIHTAQTRQTVTRHNGIRDKRVRGIHTGQQHRCHHPVPQNIPVGKKAQQNGHCKH